MMYLDVVIGSSNAERRDKHDVWKEMVGRIGTVVEIVVKALMRIILIILLLSYASEAFCGNTGSARTPVTEDKDSAGAFVQDFYDWYSPIAFREKNSLPWVSALTQHKELFSLKLVYALKRDSMASSNIDGTYTGLDTDPFVNTDNPCEHYLVAQVLEYTKTFRTDIQAVCNGKLQSRVVVSAEVVFKKDHWQFTDFYYPEGRDLFQLLAELRKERRNDLK